MTTLDYHLSDGVATLTMNRPEARNALSTEMKDDFARLVPQIATDPAVRAVILELVDALDVDIQACAQGTGAPR